MRNRYLIKSDCPTALQPLEPFFPDYAKLEQLSSKNAEMVSKGQSRDFIYIISPTQRSGTNYLHSILSLHPKLYTPQSEYLPSETFLFFHSDLLIRYCEETFRIWKHWCKCKDEALENAYKRFLAKTGDGIIGFFMEFVPEDKMLLLRTPDAQNIQYFPHLFPAGKMVILMRDGRDTVQSFIDSWGAEPIFKQFAQRWKNRRDQVEGYMEMMKRNNVEGRAYLLHYENLLNEPEKEVEQLLDYLGLDKGLYAWDKLKGLPVLGSSKSKTQGTSVNWKPMDKKKWFEPTGKWKKWSKKKQAIYDGIMGLNGSGKE